MDINSRRQEISRYLRFTRPDHPVPFTVQEVVQEQGYTRSLIVYTGDEGDEIPAYLLLPEGKGPFAAVLVHHQHHGQRHFGKSEVCGLVGDPLQAFGPALAQKGMVVLAPDSICFEDRRRNQRGTQPGEKDVDQHYNEMCYRLLHGDTLMRKVLADSAWGLSLLQAHPQVDPQQLGILGHSYGGNTVLFHAALDERIRYACASGSACSYAHKLAHDIGIEMAEVIPGFASRFDIHNLVDCMAPRPVLIVSATNDFASQDADKIIAQARKAYASLGHENYLEHARYEGGHSLTKDRFQRIVEWMIKNAGGRPG